MHSIHQSKLHIFAEARKNAVARMAILKKRFLDAEDELRDT